MSEDGTKTKMAQSLIPSGNYMFTQSALLFLHYGMEYKMPSWVVWFPSILYGIFASIIILILIAILIVGVLTD